MTSGESLYLVMVVCAFLAYAGTLIYCTLQSPRK